MIQIGVWWLVMQALGWLAFPTAMRVFRWLPDRGYAFSKALGLLVVSFVLWFGASTGLLNNDAGGILFAVLVLAGISSWIYLRRKKSGLPDIGAFLREKWKLVFTVEVLFALALVGWAILRAYAPYKIEPSGGEKFMESAFQNAIMRSQHFPPLDPWLSSFAISYYYFGYVMLAMLTRLTGAVSGVAFDLYDSLLFALTMIGAFGVAYNLVAHSLKGRQAQGDGQAREGPALATGVLGGLLVSVMGNLEGGLESLHASGVLPERFWSWIDIPDLIKADVIHSFYPGQLFIWWWRASRVLADKNLLGQDMIVQPIDEFPSFSFLLGDNHPHVLALPFVLLAIGLALNLLLRQAQAEPVHVSEDDAPTVSRQWWNPAAYCLGNDWLLFVFSALILGSLGFLNTWDLPIYLGLMVLAYGMGCVLVKGALDWEIVLRSIVLGVGVGILSVLMYIFFYLSFSSQAAGILPYVFPPTRLPQYFVMFGTFIFLLTCFLAISLHKQAEDKSRAWKSAFNWWWRILLVCIGVFLIILLLIALVLYILHPTLDTPLGATLSMVLGGMSLGDAFAASLKARLSDPWLLLLLSALLALVVANVLQVLKRRTADESERSEPVGANSASFSSSSDSFVFLLIFTGLALTLLVEFVYLRDSFGVRMNTVFKFYYQAWVMLGLASAYGVWWVVAHLEKSASRLLFSLGVVVFIGLGMVYPLMAIPSRAADFKGPANLDGASTVAQNNPDDWAAIQWLDANATAGVSGGGVPVILEAPNAPPSYRSYTYEGRISTFTGFPTVLGWGGHESQWRGNYDEQGKREPDIRTIYTTTDGNTALDLLHKWGVNYVIVGSPEMSYIQSQCSQPGTGCNLNTALHKFDQVLQPVFKQGNMTIYQVP